MNNKKNEHPQRMSAPTHYCTMNCNYLNKYIYIYFLFKSMKPSPTKLYHILEIKTDK